MDATTPKYSEARYNEIKKIISFYLNWVGYVAIRIVFIPISGLEGDNMIRFSKRMSWYKGRTLYLALDCIDEPKRPMDKHLGLPVQDVYKIGNIRNVPAGQVENGTLNSEMVALCGPYDLTTKIEMYQESLLEDFPADNAAFTVNNVAVMDCGYVHSKSEDELVKRVNNNGVDKMDPTFT